MRLGLCEKWSIWMVLLLSQMWWISLKDKWWLVKMGELEGKAVIYILSHLPVLLKRRECPYLSVYTHNWCLLLRITLKMAMIKKSTFISASPSSMVKCSPLYYIWCNLAMSSHFIGGHAFAFIAQTCFFSLRFLLFLVGKWLHSQHDA